MVFFLLFFFMPCLVLSYFLLWAPAKHSNYPPALSLWVVYTPPPHKQVKNRNLPNSPTVPQFPSWAINSGNAFESRQQ